jgi:CBS domain containing-hemolysin-like protein
MIESVLVIGITLVLAALFSAIEIAFLAANKFKIGLKSSQGERAAVLLNRFVNDTSRFFSTILIGNNVSIVVYSLSSAVVLDWALERGFNLTDDRYPVEILVIETLVSTLVLITLGEYLPKVFVSRNDPDRFILLMAPVLHFAYVVLRPIVLVAEAGSRVVLYTFLGIRGVPQNKVFLRADLERFVEEALSDDPKPPVDSEVFSNALDFNEIRVREFMVPRTDIVAISILDSIQNLRKLFRQTELSRIVVYEETLDNVRGFVHHLSMFKQPEVISEVLQPALFVPESMMANVLLTEFNRERRSLAIVLDEFGGTAGLLTLEDLVEVVFGEIQDEHDTLEDESYGIQEVLGHNLYRFSARLPTELLTDLYGLYFPDGDYTTLGGFIMHQTERIPVAGETLYLGSYIITVEQATPNRLDVVKLQVDGPVHESSRR